jgi:flagellar protein FlgJ
MTTLPLSTFATSSVASPSAAAVADPAAAREQAKLQKVAKGFEAVFVRQLIGSMRSAGFDDDLTGSSAVEQFQEMSDAKTADNMAEHGGLGIAEMLLNRLAPKGADTASGATAAAMRVASGKGTGG